MSRHSSILRDGEDDTSKQHGVSALPWYKVPSPLWPLALIPLITSAVSATFAPRIEIYTQLICATLKPDFLREEHLLLPGFAAGRCASDPAVQAEVAKLSAVITACAGVLTCITTGWWGSFSDRHGRTRVMGIPIAGLFLTDLNFILTAHFWRYLPGGHWTLVVGPIIGGSLGGIAAAVVALNAYLADTTTPATRSRFLSLSLGLIFAGMSIGPTLGSLIIHATGNALSVFYVDGAAHLLFALYILFVVPESRTPSDRRLSRAKYAGEESSGSVWKLPLKFFSPLSVFWPVSVSATGPVKIKNRWSLLLVAMSYGLVLSVTETFNVKFQYTSATFGWSPETNGYWLSLIGAVRALFLALIIPAAIKHFSPPSPPHSLSHTLPETQPLLSYSRPVSFRVELRLARISLLVALTAYIFMAFAPTSRVFMIASLFGAMGAGFGPAVQTVALGMFLGGRTGGESGRLLGGLGVVQALCTEILGPVGYGFIYMNTAGTFPRAIFFVSCGAMGLASVMLACVRDDVTVGMERE